MLDLLKDFNTRIELVTDEVQKQKLKKLHQSVNSDNARDLIEAFYDLFNGNVEKDKFGLLEDLRSAILFAIGERGTFGSIVEQQHILLKIKELENLPFKERVLEKSDDLLKTYAMIIKPPQREELLTYYTDSRGIAFGNTALSQTVSKVIMDMTQEIGISGVIIDINKTIDLDKELVIGKPYYNLSSSDVAMAILQEADIENNSSYSIYVSMEDVDNRTGLLKYGIVQTQKIEQVV